MAGPSGASHKRDQKRKVALVRDADPTESSDSGNVRKKVRWDGDITEQDEETDETEDDSSRTEKVRDISRVFVVPVFVFSLSYSAADMHGGVLPIVRPVGDR